MHEEIRVEILAGADELARAAAERFARRARRAVEGSGTFSVALAGGRTPRALYELLTRPPYRRRIPWADCVLVVGDERHVPPHHTASNYGMVRAALLDDLPEKPRAVCRFRAEEPDPETVVRRYEADLRRLLGLQADELPRLDLVLLGLGGDAHTASLFPGSSALQERERLAAAPCIDPESGTHRFTLTPPVLNHASAVVFLVSGESKARAVRDVLEGPHDPARRPAQIVRPASGDVCWMLDRAAARMLSG